MTDVVFVGEDQTLIVAVGDQGPPGPPGSGGGNGQSYSHTQGSAALEWTVNHNLGYRPAVTVFDATGNPVLAGISHVSVNQTIISFIIPISGSARFN